MGRAIPPVATVRTFDTRLYVHESATMANRQNYDVVVDVDNEGDLGHTDLNDDLEFHNSSMSCTRLIPSSSV